MRGMFSPAGFPPFPAVRRPPVSPGEAVAELLQVSQPAFALPQPVVQVPVRREGEEEPPRGPLPVAALPQRVVQVPAVPVNRLLRIARSCHRKLLRVKEGCRTTDKRWREAPRTSRRPDRISHPLP